MSKPRFLHNCKVCTFRGQHERFDVWFCEAFSTWIARYGNKGWEYASYPTFIITEKYRSGLLKSQSFKAVERFQGQVGHHVS